MIDIDKLEALAKAADQNEWSVAPRVSTYKVCDSDPARQALLESYGYDRFEAVSVGTRHGQIANVPLDESSRENAEFIATANPAAILALIAEVRALREREKLLINVCVYADSVCGMLRGGGWPGKAEALESRIKAVIEFDEARAKEQS